MEAVAVTFPKSDLESAIRLRDGAHGSNTLCLNMNIEILICEDALVP